MRVDNKVGSVAFSVEYTWELRQQSDASVKYDLGQCIEHKAHGYKGVIIGWDTECRQSEEWCQRADVAQLRNGKTQPFYIVLVGREDLPFNFDRATAKRSAATARS